ncbi:trafficking regulator of GLUT4 1 isoform X2 [Ursus arctos]|uniref:trafficking regulator of GLUT4 1 isoform X2 n=1 Tax=Ursus arctos TaxID=9644 RepID=UPI001CF8C2B9|nr:trafficking regulator of GLUT4 1 isoform X2 [Ursus arctos]
MASPVQPQFPSAQEPGTALPPDLREMEKLLTMGEGEDDKAPKLSKSLSGALDLEQNGHGLPFKVASEGRQEATLPWSASRASSRRASSIATASSAQDQEVPKDYLILAIASCFCPVWPLNLIPLIFSIMSRSSVQQGDLDGARRLGRLARLLSVTFFIMGVIIIIVAVTVNFAGETQPHGAERASLLGCRRNKTDQGAALAGAALASRRPPHSHAPPPAGGQDGDIPVLPKPGLGAKPPGLPTASPLQM